MSPGEISAIIKREILAAGFDSCGITSAVELSPEKELYRRWIGRGCHAGMGYLERNTDKRADPSLLVEGTKSVVVAIMNYFPGTLPDSDDNPVISRYVTGTDYHTVVRKRLGIALDASRATIPGLSGRVFADSAPVMEKALAFRAGVGVRGRNTLLIADGIGSYVFIGVVLINLEAEYDSASRHDICGTCRRCIDACPTGAIREEGFVDAARCISYLTIEHRGEIPERFRGLFRDRIIGCDICQEVCPHNNQPPLCRVPELARDTRLEKRNLVEWATLTPDEFSKIFSGTTVERCGYEGFMRNLRFVQGENK